MMKKSLAFAGLLLFVAGSLGCHLQRLRGNGVIKTEQREVGAFTELEAGGLYEIEWKPGTPSLSITTDENILPHIRSEMRGDRLKIETRDRAIMPTKSIKILVSSPSLKAVQLSGAAQFTASRLSGNTFGLETEGASKVTLTGAVKRMLADLTGASKLQALDLTAQDVELSVTGAGKAEITATNSIKAAITGAGKISYAGHPKTVQKQVTGAGKIEPSE